MQLQICVTISLVSGLGNSFPRVRTPQSAELSMSFVMLIWRVSKLY